jgi:hypothetical protein
LDLRYCIEERLYIVGYGLVEVATEEIDVSGAAFQYPFFIKGAHLDKMIYYGTLNALFNQETRQES